jgi:RNA polymerase sigma-70 factor (ECF subfamily)
MQAAPGVLPSGAGSLMAVFPLRRRISAGARDAFDRDVLSHTDALFRAALRMTRDRSAAEDLVQDTLLKAFRAASRFEAGTNLRAWLFTILVNTSRNRRRASARDIVEIDSQTVETAEPLPEQAATPEDLLLRDILDADLQAALDALPDVFREAVWLRDVEEFSYAEIARIIDVPVGTVMSRISRGRRMLHARLSASRPGLTGGPAVATARGTP